MQSCKEVIIPIKFLCGHFVSTKIYYTTENERKRKIEKYSKDLCSFCKEKNIKRKKTIK